jgi:hypothetical protein
MRAKTTLAFIYVLDIIREIHRQMSMFWVSTKGWVMFAVNDALADEIIRASIAGGPHGAAPYLHSAAVRMPALHGPDLRPKRLSPPVALRRMSDRLDQHFRTAAPASKTCCAVT